MSVSVQAAGGQNKTPFAIAPNHRWLQLRTFGLGLAGVMPQLIRPVNESYRKLPLGDSEFNRLTSLISKFMGIA